MIGLPCARTEVIRTVRPSDNVAGSAPQPEVPDVESEVRLVRETQAYFRLRMAGLRTDVPTDDDADVWREFYAFYQPRIRQLVWRIGIAGADLEDCAQEVWVNIFRGLTSVKTDDQLGEFSSWLCRITLRRAKRFHRQLSRDLLRSADQVGEGLTSEHPDGGDVCQQNECQAIVQRALRIIGIYHGRLDHVTSGEIGCQEPCLEINSPPRATA